MNTLIASLKLFNAVQVEEKNKSYANLKNFGLTVKNGFILHPSINPKLIPAINEFLGVGGAKLNSSFHKSWGKIKNASMEQLVIEQIVHYITTYGFESIGIFDSNTVYIPAEKLELPKKFEAIPLTFVNALTADEILEQIIVLGSSGMALSTDSLDAVLTLVKANKYDYNFVSQITNNELYALLCDYYEIVPTEPMKYLRFLITKLTGQSLVIKNPVLIAKIKQADSRILDKFIESAPDDLASIFLRYKPLFLAMKSISRNKTFFNKLRKDAVYMHKPLPVDYLNGVTGQINSGEFKISELKEALTHYNIWRKIRLAYALNNRLNGDLSTIVYTVRNGKGWVSDFEWYGSEKDTQKALKATLKSIANDISNSVNGKTVYIPENIVYALPRTQKQFVGNIPANSYVVVQKDLVVGAHWYNHDDGNKYRSRVDLDLSLLDVTGKYGWDRHYRNDERTILFSGDVTDAPRPHGATELFYVNRLEKEPKLIIANDFTFEEGNPVDCQLVVASERVKDFQKNYMINPNNLVMSQSVNISKKQNILGLISGADDGMRVYFVNISIGDSITSRETEHTTKARKFLVDSCMNIIPLSDVLSMAGANVVREMPEDEDFINLSNEALNKNTFIQLLTGVE